MYRGKTHGFIKDMDKTELLKMRESGMSNEQIGRALGCSVWSVRNLIGSQPEEMTSANRSNGVREAKKRVRMDGTTIPAAQPARGGYCCA